MKTITFYSYKGGVGRTLVVANVAKYLAQFGLNVVALDLDLEAPGLRHKFVLDNESVPPGPGIVDYIVHFLDTGTPPDQIMPYSVSVTPPAGAPVPITLIPAGPAPAAEYWEALSRIDWHALLYTEDAPGIALFEDLKARIAAELSPDYLLIDARTGITEMGGIATSLLADVVVALTLTTTEHLEGVRSVMRSINKTRRANGDEPIQLEVALSRLPEKDDDEVRKATKRAMDFLNAPADDPKDTLDIDEALILHTDPGLQVRERLLIGSEVRGGDEDGLLSDYLRLFTKFIPLESLAPRVKELVEEAMARLLEDPLSTERSLEVLARYTGHPEALRALIRFYRVRQDSRRMLAASARLWEMREDGDMDLIWTAVREGFEVTHPYVSTDYPINLVKAVWEANGSEDVRLGLSLARTLDNFSREDEAVEVSRTLFERYPTQEVIAEAVVEHMISAGDFGRAAKFAEDHAEEFAYDVDYLGLWARAVAESADTQAAAAFLVNPLVDLDELASGSAIALARVLRTAGRPDEGVPLLDRALDRAMSSRNWEDLFELAREYAQRGVRSQRQFEGAIRSGIPEAAESFLRDVRTEVAGWRMRTPA